MKMTARGLNEQGTGKHRQLLLPDLLSAHSGAKHYYQFLNVCSLTFITYVSANEISVLCSILTSKLSVSHSRQPGPRSRPIAHKWPRTKLYAHRRVADGLRNISLVTRII
jgi:hypothetical protein